MFAYKCTCQLLGCLYVHLTYGYRHKERHEDDFTEGNYSPLDAVTPQLETQSTIPPGLLKWRHSSPSPLLKQRHSPPSPILKWNTIYPPPSSSRDVVHPSHPKQKKMTNGGSHIHIQNTLFRKCTCYCVHAC